MTAMTLRLLQSLILLLTLSASIPALAVTAAEAGRLLVRDGHLAEQQLSGLEQSADGLLLLGWLYEYGSYGVPVDGERAFGYYQQAAEQGQMDAAHYCWQRCLRFTPELRAAVQRAAVTDNSQALYLSAKLAGAEGNNLQIADRQLVAAARLMHPQAISDLYIQHFLDWSSRRQRSFESARDKLQRCSDEGVIACYLLLGALFQRHGDAEASLHNYLVLQQLDYGLSRMYLSAAGLEALEQRLPTDSLPVVRSRAATRLATHPRTGFDSIDRFAVCAPDATWNCIRTVRKRDPACMLGYFSPSLLSGFRETAYYRRCMGL